MEDRSTQIQCLVEDCICNVLHCSLQRKLPATSFNTVFINLATVFPFSSSRVEQRALIRVARTKVAVCTCAAMSGMTGEHRCSLSDAALRPSHLTPASCSHLSLEAIRALPTPITRLISVTLHTWPFLITSSYYDQMNCWTVSQVRFK